MSKLPYGGPWPYNPQAPTMPGYDNPGQTLPFPMPGPDMPAQTGDFPGVKLSWSGIAPVPPSTAASSTVRQAFWSSVTFDLKPWLRKDQSDNHRGTFPIWTPGSLHVQMAIQADENIRLTYLNIRQFEEAHPNDLRAMYAVTAERELSMDLLVGNPPHTYPANVQTENIGLRGVTEFASPGGVAFRYWRVCLVFNLSERFRTDPSIYISASYN